MVDLSQCKYGDILLCKTGAIIKYIRPTSKDEINNYYDHVIEYLFIPNENKVVDSNHNDGTRTNDGFVFRKNRLETDHDVVAIIELEKLLETLIKS
jgi:hypothetical protein